jgi:ATP-dependent DNA helicase RecQ
VDVLLGAETERILKLGHNRLKTFGVGTELDRRGWLSVFRQLIAQGFVLPDIAGHGGLSLAPSAAEILRGTRTVQFRRDERRREARGSRADAKSGMGSGGLDPAAKAIWDALRAWRLAEARRQELPPYVIFHDSTLSEVARRRPLSLAALAQIPGIGRSKLERYGSAVIEIVAAGTSRSGSQGL